MKLPKTIPSYLLPPLTAVLLLTGVARGQHDPLPEWSSLSSGPSRRPRPESTLKTYSRTDFHEMARTGRGADGGEQRSTLETYKRRSWQDVVEKRRESPEPPPLTTLRRRRGSAFQQRILAGERAPEPHPNQSDLETYRLSERSGEEGAALIRWQESRRRLRNVRRGLLRMGFNDQAERIDEILQKERRYHRRKLERLREFDSTAR